MHNPRNFLYYLIAYKLSFPWIAPRWLPRLKERNNDHGTLPLFLSLDEILSIQSVIGLANLL